ncbi:peptidyl-tRNA hydrolase 2, mitochondrial-like [Anoplophora glabripennis]|uniref:peptidyl-tRNA hydrolase 2, mitochondrial-like n=1 Tax=Anoplophora glabripennis TaxID=217634 RepID=UPI0008742D87|nr:peptidyl-tRNA hydrolase 2, mitochondrial-like [Anoplophora glabripennis]
MFISLVKKVAGFNTTKMIIIIRTDLQMGRGKIASQAAHAAVLLYQSSIENSNPCLQTWLRCGQPKVVLKIDTNCDSALLNIYEEALASHLNVCRVHDAGKTQVVEGTLTAVGIGPNKVEEIDKITSDLKLL